MQISQRFDNLHKKIMVGKPGAWNMPIRTKLSGGIKDPTVRLGHVVMKSPCILVEADYNHRRLW